MTPQSKGRLQRVWDHCQYKTSPMATYFRLPRNRIVMSAFASRPPFCSFGYILVYIYIYLGHRAILSREN